MAMLLSDTAAQPNPSVPSHLRVRRAAPRRVLLRLLVLTGLAAGSVPLGRWAQFEWYKAQGKQSLRHFDAEAAVAAFDAAHHLRPKSAEVEYLLGAAHRRAGHLDRAAEHLAQAERLHWWSRQIRRQQVMLSFQAGQIDQSQAAIDDLLATSNSDAEAEEIYDCLVRGYLAEYRLDRAKTCLDHWIAWQSHAARPRLWRADLFSLVDKQQQLKEYESVLRIEPDNVDARLGRAQLLVDAGRVQEARDEYQGCLNQSPENEVATLGLAACQRHQSELTQARQTLSRLVPRPMSDEKRSFLLTELGRLDLAEGAYAAAAEQLSQAVKLDPWNSPAHYSLGLALGHMARKQEAQQHLDHWREIDDLRSRLAELERRIVLEPQSGEIRAQIGETLAHLGRGQEAASWYLSALRCDAANPSAHQALATYYAQIGRQDLADRHRGARAAVP